MATSLQGPAGPLEALLRLPPEIRGAAVVAHPHPRLGGTMHSKVVHRAARLLARRFGLATLRFNFRGVGASRGRWDGGAGETDDLVAAARWLRGRYPAGPFLVGGFSFGALCALDAASSLLPDVLFLIGLPVGRGPELGEVPDAVRVFWIQGEKDTWGPAPLARSAAEGRGWDFDSVPGADHFFAGALERFEEASAEGLQRALEGRPA